jgi:hypothetical protein
VTATMPIDLLTRVIRSLINLFLKDDPHAIS